MSQDLKVEISKAGVATLTLNRPNLHNAFNDVLIASITKEIKRIEADDKVRIIVLTGEGRSFCAGADLNWMKGMIGYSESENITDSKKLFAMFETINQCLKPVIGKINGHALGGGVGLVSVCDFVMTHEKASFGFTETRLGLVPAVISSFCIDKIGKSNARAWFLSGERFNATKAFEMGLVHEVTTVEEFESRFDAIVESFILAAPKAQLVAKKLIENITKLNTEEVLTYSCQTIAKQRVSNEGQEGMKALLEKRKANWIKNV
jgi:methylglutaconyl-CoA hydratase